MAKLRDARRGMMNDEAERAEAVASGNRLAFRLLRTVALSLLAGAILTVLVAWAIALQAEPSFVSRPTVFEWPGPVDDDWPARPTSLGIYSATWGPGGLKQRSAWGANDGSMRADFRMWVTESGWPAPALRSTLRASSGDALATSFGAGPYDNGGSLEAGLALRLHNSRPHDAGPEGWSSRRLPLNPMPVGFAASAAFWSALAFGLLVVRGLASNGTVGWRRRWRKRCVLLAMGLGLNIAVAFGLWMRWVYGSGDFPAVWSRPGASSALHATELNDPLAVWPAQTPRSWPDRPDWIGWHGSVWGVQAYQYTSRGIPAAAAGWYFVTWDRSAFDELQQVHIVQIGWPLPCLQSEELIDEPPPGSPEEVRAGGRFWTPFVRTGALLDATLPGAPRPTSPSRPAPFLPVRPLALGMLLNTLLFSAAIGLAVSIPGAVRTLRRRARGRCMKCGYDVQMLPRCPECGLVQPRPDISSLSDESLDRTE